MLTFEQYLNEETRSGTYICARFTEETNKNLKAYAESLGLNPIEKFHATIVFSVDKLDIDNGKVPMDNQESAKVVGMKYLGDKDSEWRAIVLVLKSKVLDALYKKYVKEYGYKNPHDSYIQHVSLAYKPDENMNLKEIKLPDFNIEFKEQVIEDLK